MGSASFSVTALKACQTVLIHHFGDLIAEKYIKIIKRRLKCPGFAVINSPPWPDRIRRANRYIAVRIHAGTRDCFPIKKLHIKFRHRRGGEKVLSSAKPPEKKTDGKRGKKDECARGICRKETPICVHACVRGRAGPSVYVKMCCLQNHKRPSRLLCAATSALTLAACLR